MADRAAENALDRVIDDLERNIQSFDNWTHGLSPISDEVGGKVRKVLNEAVAKIQKIRLAL